MSKARLARSAVLLLLALGTASCAYYNTFYLARKYYLKATDGQPYEVDREGTTQRSNYTKSGDYSKKLLGVYSTSKWVDDAWLMWARTLVGTDDPLKAVAMLEEFQTRFPKSELRGEAEFFLGLSYRAARKHEQAIAAFDEFLVQAPKHDLVPYAWYERSKALISLRRYREAAESAGQILEKYKSHLLYDRALRQRAEARYQQRDWAGARADFHIIGARALTDEERLKFLLREVDCVESSRDFDQARALLRDARSHTVPPPPIPALPRIASTPNAGNGLPQNQPPPAPVVRSPAQEVYGRLTLRLGGVEVLDGRIEPAVELYRAVIADYPRSQLAAEAQYRIGFAYETGANDFAKARGEYAKVREQVGASQFAQQADQRLENLDRIERYRTAGGADSLARQAEARFLTAELFLFGQDKPQRAVEVYRAIADSSPQPAVRARAMNAQAWVMARKLGQKDAADSLFWKVVRDYPATEGQLAARDYLEGSGQVVPANLIVAPREIAKPVLDPADEALTSPPGGTSPLGRKREASIVEPGAVRFGPGVGAPSAPGAALPAIGNPSQWRYNQLPDSLRRAMMLRDSLVTMARRDTSAVGRARVDSLRRALARPDTLGRGALMAEIQRQVAKADTVVVSPDDAPPPNFEADSTATGDRDVVTPPASTRNVFPAPALSPLPAAPRVGVPPAVVQADTARHSGAMRRTPADSVLDVARARLDNTHAAVRIPPSPGDSLARASAIADSFARSRAVTDSLARVRAAADSLAKHKGKKLKVKPVSDPNVGFSSVWTKPKPKPERVKQDKQGGARSARPGTMIPPSAPAPLPAAPRAAVPAVVVPADTVRRTDPRPVAPEDSTLQAASAGLERAAQMAPKPAADSVRHDAPSRHAAADSVRKAAPRTATAADSMRALAARRPARPDSASAKPAAPIKPALTPAPRDSARRAVARRDSVSAKPATSAKPALTAAERDSVRRAVARQDSVRRAQQIRTALRADAESALALRARLKQFDPLRAEAARRDSVRRASQRADSLKRVKAKADSLKRVVLARSKADSLARVAKPAAADSSGRAK